MKYLKLFLNLFYFFVIFQQVNGMRWFNFKKEDKDDKEDCEPEIVAIRKQKIIPVAIPVYNRKRTYSVKTRRLRKKYEDDEDSGHEKKVQDTETNEEQDTEQERSESLNNEKIASTDKTPSSNEKPNSPNKLNDRSDNTSIDKVKSIKNRYEDDEDSNRFDSTDYETDEIIKKEIEDDDEDLEEFMSNDDL